MVRAHIQCNSMTSLWSMVLHQMKYTKRMTILKIYA
jgi:hypothetical protein